MEHLEEAMHILALVLNRLLGSSNLNGHRQKYAAKCVPTGNWAIDLGIFFAQLKRDVCVCIICAWLNDLWKTVLLRRRLYCGWLSRRNWTFILQICLFAPLLLLLVASIKSSQTSFVTRMTSCLGLQYVVFHHSPHGLQKLFPFPHHWNRNLKL